MIEFTFPSQIGPFKKGRVVSHEARHPGAGYGIAYHGNIADEATVYVYDNRLDSIPSDPMDEIVLGEFQATMRDIHQHYASQGVAPELVGLLGPVEDVGHRRPQPLFPPRRTARYMISRRQAGTDGSTTPMASRKIWSASLRV